MNKFITCLSLLLLWQSNFILFAQQDSLPIRENIQSKSFVTDNNTIKLRWSPANTKAWSDGKKYGYLLERYTIMIDNQWQKNPEKIVLSENLKPQELNNWEEAAIKSDYAAAIAQAFYGEDFNVSASSNDVESIINQSNELEQRFAISVFMAEYDFEAALLAGWGYIDNRIKTGERYLYRIILNRPVKQAGDTAAVFIGIADKQELPKPIQLDAVWGDCSTMLLWNYELLANTYHSYHVERKTESDNLFQRITELPITALTENMQTVFFKDSLPDNEYEYAYRIVGITGFGEEGPASDTIVGKGQKTVTCVPYIYSGYFTGANHARIHWEFECAELELIDYLVVKRAALPEEEYVTILESIAVDAKEADLYLQDDVNYVKLFAVDKNGQEKTSFPFALNKIDSIPPSIPTGLKVEIDSTGVAHLAWNANTESDLRGYRILRSFTEQGEKSSLLPDFLTVNEFTDTLSLALGNPKVYYALTALDQRYNESEPCLTIAAVKPNLITPVKTDSIDQKVKDNLIIPTRATAAISNFSSYTDHNKNYIELRWKKHPDATLYRLYKQTEPDGHPVLWKELDGDQTMVVDEIITVDTQYIYTILFVSKDGKFSQFKSITVNY
jgi:fibronectin type 3 domain-containing protein